MLKLYLLAVLAVVIQSAQAQTRQPCVNLDISYAIIADSSSSVLTANPDEWTFEKVFIKNFAAQTGLGTNSRIKIGLVNYGQFSTIVANCNAASTSSLTSFNSLVDGMARQQGGTAIYHGLQRAQEILGGNGCGRTGEKQVALLLTDGTENVETDLAKRMALENAIRAQATVYAVAVGSGTNYADLRRLTGKDSLIRSFSSWEALSQDNATLIWLTVANEFCDVGGRWSSWGAYGACSPTCGTGAFKTRNRVCQNPITFQTQTDCPGSSTGAESCVFVECPGVLSQWSAFSACSATCQMDVNVKHTQTRTRSCSVGNCNNAILTVTQDCNVNVACPGILSQWSAYSVCSSTCQFNINVNVPAIQTRVRTCTQTSFGGNCGGASLSGSSNCNVGVSCTGPAFWGQWGAYGACSETCQSNVNVSPSYTRSRTCVNGPGCPGSSTQNANCNSAVPCPGILSIWSVYGACSASCQKDTTMPMKIRTRTCQFATFGGNCNGATLTDSVDCNKGVPCGDCPTYMKPCSCNTNVSQYTTGAEPKVDLVVFNGITPNDLTLALSYLTLWTKDIVNKLCKDAKCNEATLTNAINSITININNLVNIDTALKTAQAKMRNVIDCNSNKEINDNLFAVYDYLCERAIALNQIKMDLMSKKMMLAAEKKRCDERGWFKGLLENWIKKP